MGQVMSNLSDKEELLRNLRDLSNEIEDFNSSSEHFDEDYAQWLIEKRRAMLDHAYSKVFGSNVRCFS